MWIGVYSFYRSILYTMTNDKGSKRLLTALALGHVGPRASLGGNPRKFAPHAHPCRGKVSKSGRCKGRDTPYFDCDDFHPAYQKGKPPKKI